MSVSKKTIEDQASVPILEMEGLVNEIHDVVLSMKINAANSDKGNNAAALRMRKDSLFIEKLCKALRIRSLYPKTT